MNDSASHHSRAPRSEQSGPVGLCSGCREPACPRRVPKANLLTHGAWALALETPALGRRAPLWDSGGRLPALRWAGLWGDRRASVLPK